MRAMLLYVHRYIGLATALFLALAGITGSILAFHHELDEWLNPGFYNTQGAGAPMLPGDLVDRLQTEHPQLQVWYMEYPDEAEHPALMAMVPRSDPRTQQPYAGARAVVYYVDTANGQTLGQRFWGDCCFSRENFVPFMLEFHYNLTLPGIAGLWLMGLVAIFWSLDCLVALALTLPKSRPFWGKWSTAWKIKPKRLNYDVHRAGGLWLWLLLTPVAVSSIAMNLPAEVFKPLVSVFSPVPLSVYEARGRLPKEQLGETQLDYHQLYQRALEEGERQGLSGPIGELYYSFEYNFFGAGFGAHDSEEGNAWLYFHGSDGRLLGKEIPGQGSLGERFYQLQLPIHGGRILGLPGRILIAVLGVAIAVLSFTGVVIWWRKLRARRRAMAAKSGFSR